MTKLLVANLKSNYKKEEILKLVEYLDNIDISNNIIICPSSIYLPYFNIEKYDVGIQNISMFQEGAYTGEIAASQAKSLGIKYAIIGHYERRKYFHEDNKILKEKINRCLESNLKGILCISSIDDLEILKNLDSKNIIIVYEPIVAIGTNKLPSILEIKKEINLIKLNINKDLKVLYGGSVDDININDIIKINEIDGFMISSSVLNKEKFLKIKEVIDNQ